MEKDKTSNILLFAKSDLMWLPFERSTTCKLYQQLVDQSFVETLFETNLHQIGHYQQPVLDFP